MADGGESTHFGTKLKEFWATCKIDHCNNGLLLPMYCERIHVYPQLIRVYIRLIRYIWFLLHIYFRDYYKSIVYTCFCFCVTVTGLMWLGWEVWSTRDVQWQVLRVVVNSWRPIPHPQLNQVCSCYISVLTPAFKHERVAFSRAKYCEFYELFPSRYIIILMIIIIFNAVGESQTRVPYKLLKPEHVIGLPPGITLRPTCVTMISLQWLLVLSNAQ